MKYLMLVCLDPQVDPANPEVPEDEPIEKWVADLDSRGVRLDGDRLQPASRSRVVRVRRGGTLVTDGPFAEVLEQVVGFDLLECADDDEAAAVAARHPMARRGLIELRPVWPLED